MQRCGTPYEEMLGRRNSLEEEEEKEQCLGRITSTQRLVKVDGGADRPVARQASGGVVQRSAQVTRGRTLALGRAERTDGGLGGCAKW